MSRKAVAVTITTAATIAVIIGLTTQATAYAAEDAEAPELIGYIITLTGFLTLAATTPFLLAAVRTAAHDDAYLTLLADEKHDRAIARGTKAPVLPIDRRAK